MREWELEKKDIMFVLCRMEEGDKERMMVRVGRKKLSGCSCSDDTDIILETLFGVTLRKYEKKESRLLTFGSIAKVERVCESAVKSENI